MSLARAFKFLSPEEAVETYGLDEGPNTWATSEDSLEIPEGGYIADIVEGHPEEDHAFSIIEERIIWAHPDGRWGYYIICRGQTSLEYEPLEDGISRGQEKDLLSAQEKALEEVIEKVGGENFEY